ncbi:MAG: acetyl/propionyl/methylcrotonyl-CoA carboxylase subunit alpha [Burkholderiales bacterium]
MIRRLLIANRGEIASRIARTCTRMGIEYVGVYSEADAAAPHLRGAVAKSCIGPPIAAQSYLDQKRIIGAAQEHACDAIHPGYGFLSENAQFARAVAAAGLRFVGPSAEIIAALGDKARAKEIMRDAGVPTVPGMAHASEDLNELKRAAKAIGYPLLLKPSAGGGGKGMQVVHESAALRETLERAMRLARGHFADGRLILERYLDRARHVEVQIFGDSHGNVVHLFERECSLQRRHQKIIEEAPAPGLGDELRAQLLAAAVRGAKAAGYDNAGTFEFILSGTGEFYFLEVNTRLQVEHPVTEAITGLDLVEWQLRCASGETLPLAQEDIHAAGHAFECRVYAEDPANDFRPAPGRAIHVAWPQAARIEAGIAGGDEVTPYYDPLVAKLITQGQTRAEARAAMLAALRSTAVLGLTTNLGFLQHIMNDPNIARGTYHTQYLDAAPFKPQDATAEAIACACAATLAVERMRQPRWPWSACHPLGVFDRTWLVHDAPLGELWFWVGHELRKGAIRHWDESSTEVFVAEQRFCVQIDAAQGSVLHGKLGDISWHAARASNSIELTLDGTRYSLPAYADRNPAQFSIGASALSPMPGVVVSLPAKLGQTVSEGEVLAIVEAMKMENKVTAAFAGTVTAINCRLNQAVNAGDLLVTVEPAE